MTDLPRQFVRFSAVGLLNTLIGLTAIYALMYFFRSGPAAANVIGYAIGVAASFVLNRSWTFGSNLSILSTLPNYVRVAGVCYLLNLAAVIAATSHFSANPCLAQVLGVGIYTSCMFFGCRRFVFRARDTT